MATTIEVPRKLITDVTYVLRGEGDAHAGPQQELAEKLDSYVTKASRTATCDRRRSLPGESIHKGVHVCGLKASHVGQHQCGRNGCQATWRQLVRNGVNH